MFWQHLPYCFHVDLLTLRLQILEVLSCVVYCQVSACTWKYIMELVNQERIPHLFNCKVGIRLR